MIGFIAVSHKVSTSCHFLQVVEHDDGLLGECDELDALATGMEARSHLDTAGSSINGNTAVMLEAALSSAVMHQNVVQTYDYQTRLSSLSGGQVSFALHRSGINVLALWQTSLEAIRRSTTQIWVTMSMQHSITVQFFHEPFAHYKEPYQYRLIRYQTQASIATGYIWLTACAL